MLCSPTVVETGDNPAHDPLVLLAINYEQLEISKVLLVVGASFDEDRVRGLTRKCGMPMCEFLSSYGWRVQLNEDLKVPIGTWKE